MVARRTVERLTRELDLADARRGKPRRTTVADPAAARPADLVKRRFSPPTPHRLWVTDHRSGDIRAWAKNHGIAVSERRRIPASVVQQYQAATAQGC
jgi:transposase InsO family protein